MVVPVVTSARARCACGGTDCPDCPPGACADGEECLPSDFIDPDDCPGGEGAPCFDLLASGFGADIDDATTDPIDTTGATLLVAFATSPVEPDSFDDSEGNTWVTVAENTPGASFGFVYYAENPTTSAAHTFHATLPSSSGLAIVLAAFVGPSITGAFDGSSSENGTGFQTGSGSPLRPGSITPSADRALVVTMAGGDDLTAPYIAGYQVFEDHDGAPGVSGAISVAFQVQGTATATNPEWTAPEVTDPETWGGAVLAVAFLTDIECDPSAACADCAPCEEGGGPTAPDGIEDLLFWYDATDSGTVTFTGDQVETWADKSANGLDLTQDQAGAPRLLPASLNGLDGVYFPVRDGGNPRMRTDPGTPIGGVNAPLTIFAVIRFDLDESTASGDQCLLRGEDGISLLRMDGTHGGGATNKFFAAGTNPDFPNNGSLVPDSHPILATFQIDGASSFGRVNGVEIWQTDIGEQTPAIGDSIFIGGEQGGGSPMEGVVWELFGYDRALTLPEIVSMESYLTAKFFEESTQASGYAPYVLNVNENHPDVIILRTGPFGYWKLDDASGAPQDSSGNANHGSVALGTPTYAQAAITSKVGDSIALDGTARLAFPAPVNLGHVDSVSAMAALVQMTGTGNDGDGDVVWRVFMGGGAAGTGWVLSYFDEQLGGSFALDGILTALIGVNNQAVWGADEQFFDTSYPGDDPKFIILNAVNSAMEIWVNGVLVTYGKRDSSLGGTPDLFVGQEPATFWGSPAMRVSNVVSWDRTLTHAEIKAITDAVLDEAALSNAWRPQA
jgi:hypothetical protein